MYFYWQNAFSDKLEVGTIELPNSLIEIGGKAFSGTTITKISIPDNVTVIGTDAFYNCKYLQTVYLSKILNVLETELLQGVLLNTKISRFQIM